MNLLFPTPGDLPPEWALESEAAWAGYERVAGVDEAGRGPLAGPVVAGAVVLPLGCRLSGVQDSKILSPEQREALFDEILAVAVCAGLGVAGPGEIDRLNILQASLLAMRRAVSSLRPAPDFLLIDGRQVTGLHLDQRAVIKGDSRSISVGAASILAKVTRDRMMTALDRVYPGYGFVRHKGYATTHHRQALNHLGPSFAHRRTFRGVRELLG